MPKNNNINSLYNMILIRYFIGLIFLFSCKKDNNYCISNLRFTRSYNIPSPDVISVTIDRNVFLKDQFTIEIM